MIVAAIIASALAKVQIELQRFPAVRTVSYTHLDVYKRQASSLRTGRSQISGTTGNGGSTGV